MSSSSSTIWILIVEDRPTDRALLRYTIEDRFQQEAHFREAETLDTALKYLHQQPFDCVILDLQLPDSMGRETFHEVFSRFPNIPIIIMTHNKDRELAIEMIREGAADYVLKSYTDAEELFRRVLFAIEKHNRSVRIPPEHVSSIRKVERAKANMMSAHQSGQHSAVRDYSVETTSALADLSRKQFVELQALSATVGTISATVGAQSAKFEAVAATVDNLDREILRGHSGRPSMRSEVELIKHQVESTVEDVADLTEKVKTNERKHEEEQLEIKKAKMSDRTKLILGILTLVGILATAAVTYVTTTATQKPSRDAGAEVK